MAADKYIRFDWAAKKILRDKSNFSILEGLVTVLLGEEVHILELLESESKQQYPQDKFNRVDIKARNSKDEIILVEILLTREVYYLERIFYGVAKAITEHIQLGDRYNQVKKVYSISILYFDLGKGEDYVYHGQTTFRGLTKHDTLQISAKEKDFIRMKAPEEVFPEYYLIRVNAFDKLAENHLEEWLLYLKDGIIADDATAPGLQEAKRKNAIIYYDLNFRKNHKDEVNFLMPNIIDNYEYATIIKGSDEDFENIYNETDAQITYKEHIEFYSRNFVYTRGADGATIFGREFKKDYAGNKVEAVSTVGAGDNFNAGLIYGLIKNNVTYADLKGSISEEKWDKVVKSAIDFSSYVCTTLDNYVSKEYAEKYNK